ncbi:MAG: DNA polymerase III subunit delta [Clostridia bacterium]|nr:DNA polymerase III subunit delta [Clostridia bacterium]
MTAKEFFKLCRTGSPSGCYLFYGQEEYAKKEALFALRRTLFEGGDDPFNRVMLDGTAPDLFDALAGQIALLPVFAEKKLVEVHSFNFVKAPKSALDDLCTVLSELKYHEECVVVLYAESGEFEAFRSYKKPSDAYTLFEHAVQYVAFDPLSGQELSDRVRRQCAERGVTCTPEQASALIDFCSDDLSTLKNETEKLICYTLFTGRTAVDAADIPEVCCGTHTYGDYDFTDALMASDAKTAYRILSKMKDRKVAPESILGGVLDQLANMYTVRTMLDRGSALPEIVRLTGMKEFRVKKYAFAVRNRRAQRLKKALGVCMEADLQIKNSPLDKYTVIDKLVLRMSRV